MKTLAQELQTAINTEKAWQKTTWVAKAVHFFIQEMKGDLMAQARRGVEIKDMRYAVASMVTESAISTACAVLGLTQQMYLR